MKKLFTLCLALLLALALPVGAFASSGEASSGPASLTWEESAELSREAAVILLEEGEASYEGVLIASRDNDFTAVFAAGGSLTLEDVTIFTSGREAQSPNTTMHFGNANFYGTAAAVLAGEGAEMSIEDAVIVTTGEGANAVFSYGGVITLADVEIQTYGDENAHGVDAVTAGVIYGENISVYTAGINSGAAATDTGGGTIILKDSSLTARMSPGVYMDGDGVAELTNVTVTVGIDLSGETVDYMLVTNNGAEGVSEETKENTAEGLVLTGNAEITATDTDVTAPYGVKFHSQSETEQVGILTMTGGSITSTAYDVLYVTGANGNAVLDNVSCTVAEGRYLIRVCNLVPANLEEEGVGDKICAGTGDFTLQNGTYTGDVWAMNAEEEETWGAQIEGAGRYDNMLALTLSNAVWEGAAIHVDSLCLEDDAQWIVTGDSDVGTLEISDGASVTVSEGYVITADGETVTELSSGVYENVVITAA